MVFARTEWLILAVLFSPISMALGQTPADKDLQRYERTNFDVEEIVIEWASYLNTEVSVEGPIHCYGGASCDFVAVPHSDHIIGLDIFALSPAEKRHLYNDCLTETPCNVLVTGTVDDRDIYVHKISDIPKKGATQTARDRN